MKKIMEYKINANYDECIGKVLDLYKEDGIREIFKGKESRIFTAAMLSTIYEKDTNSLIGFANLTIEKQNRDF